jgi:hypothetical protein
VTLIELLIASTVVALLVGALAMMATGLRSQQEVGQQYATATMHARAALGRIQRSIRSAYANAQFPGFVVFSEKVGLYTYPDCLVVWRPGATPANPNGLPLWNEVVIYGWNPAQPNELLEITVPGNTNVVPPLSDAASWRSQLNAFRSGFGSQRVTLTDQLRVAVPAGDSRSKRGVVLFLAEMQPSAAEWDALLAGKRSWNSLSWPLNLYGTSYGVRQNRCAVEIQLRSGAADNAETALAFFTSAALLYTVQPP